MRLSTPPTGLRASVVESLPPDRPRGDVRHELLELADTFGVLFRRQAPTNARQLVGDLVQATALTHGIRQEPPAPQRPPAGFSRVPVR